MKWLITVVCGATDIFTMADVRMAFDLYRLILNRRTLQFTKNTKNNNNQSEYQSYNYPASVSEEM